MYVCLCTGVTSQAVSDAVAGGASTCNQVAAACGAGGDCGRCRRTVRDIIANSRCQRERPLNSARASALAAAPMSVSKRPFSLDVAAAI